MTKFFILIISSILFSFSLSSFSLSLSSTILQQNYKTALPSPINPSPLEQATGQKRLTANSIARYVLLHFRFSISNQIISFRPTSPYACPLPLQLIRGYARYDGHAKIENRWKTLWIGISRFFPQSLPPLSTFPQR